MLSAREGSFLLGLCVIAAMDDSLSAAGPPNPPEMMRIAMQPGMPKVIGDDAVYFLAAGSEEPHAYSTAGQVPANLYKIARNGSTMQPLLTSTQARSLIGGRMEEHGITCDDAMRRIVFVSPVEGGLPMAPASRLTLVDLQSSRVQVIVDDRQRNWMPMLSPDGEKVAYFSVSPYADVPDSAPTSVPGYSLHVFDIETSKELAATPPCLEKWPPSPPAWRPDGKAITYAAQIAAGSRPIHILHLARGEDEVVEVNINGHRYTESIVWPIESTLFCTVTGGGLFAAVNAADGTTSITVAKGIAGALSVGHDDGGPVISAEMHDNNETLRRLFDLHGNDVTAVTANRAHLGGYVVHRITKR